MLTLAEVSRTHLMGIRLKLQFGEKRVGANAPCQSGCQRLNLVGEM